MSDFLFKILSFCPIFSLSDDEKFGGCNRWTPNLRFSLFQIHIGFYKFYFISFKNRQFDFLKWIRFNEIQKWPNHDSLYEAAEKYSSRFSEYPYRKKTAHINIEKEFIEYKLEQLVLVGQRNQSKINLYMTIALASIPLLIIWIPKLSFPNYFNILLFAFFCIHAFNFYRFIYESVKVRAVSRSTFSDVKNATDKLEEFAKNLYFDWRVKKEEIEYDVGVVKNVEISLLLALFLFSFVVIVACYFGQGDVYNSQKQNYDSCEVVVDQVAERLSNDQLNRLNQLEQLCLNKKLKHIVVIRNKNFVETDLYKKVISTIEMYFLKKEIIYIDPREACKEDIFILMPVFKLGE